MGKVRGVSVMFAEASEDRRAGLYPVHHRAQVFEAVESTLTSDGVKLFRAAVAEAIANGDADHVIAAWVLTAALMSDPDGRDLYEQQAGLPDPGGEGGMTSQELWNAA